MYGIGCMIGNGREIAWQIIIIMMAPSILSPLPPMINYDFTSPLEVAPHFLAEPIAERKGKTVHSLPPRFSLPYNHWVNIYSTQTSFLSLLSYLIHILEDQRPVTLKASPRPKAFLKFLIPPSTEPRNLLKNHKQSVCCEYD